MRRETPSRRVLVTGAGGGLGLATARALAAAGWLVSAADLHPCAPEPNVVPLALDVTDPASVEAARATVAPDGVPCLDAVVHLAGVYGMDSMLEIDEAALARVLDVNLMGVYRVNRAFVPLLRPGGRVVIVTSELANIPAIPFNSVYSLSKCALDHYAHALRCELGLLGLRVVTVRPGAYSTNLIGDSQRAMERFVAGTRLYRTNAARFRAIMARFSKAKPPERFAHVLVCLLGAKRPRAVYSPNRSPLLPLLRLVPSGAQARLYRTILR